MLAVFSDVSSRARGKLFYGWIVVAAGVVLWATAAAIMTSFGVFFKPLAADFDWSRSVTSTIQSFYFVSNGFASIVWGWLADRFGPRKTVTFGGLLAGMGLILTSQVSELWQIYLTYSIMTGLSIGSIYPAVTTTVARWFVERRGLALGILASGAGLGTLVGPPTMVRLIAAFGWSRAYFVLGIAVAATIVGGACLLRRSPEVIGLRPYGLRETSPEPGPGPATRVLRHDSKRNSTLTVLRSKTLWMLISIFFLFAFCNHMVAVHLVNYATDLGIVPLAAAALLSILGLSSAAGRLLMGAASDRIGSLNTVIASCLVAAASLVLLILAGNLWMFGIFALVYGFAYGAEVPQQAALIGKFFGFQAMLVGMLHAGSCSGGALGSWVGGLVFDSTQSYQIAFLIAAAAISFSLMVALVLKRWNGRLRLTWS